MKLKESKLNDIAIEVEDHLNLDKNQNQKFTKKELYNHLQKYHGINDKDLADSIINIMEDDYPKMKIKEQQTVSGGKGDKLSPEDVDQNELAVGIEVEYEHAKGDKTAATDIALDHLKENPKYYSELVQKGIVDEPDAIKLAKKLLGVKPLKEIKEEEKIHIARKHVSLFAKWMNKELWHKKGNMMYQDWVDEKTGRVTTKKATLQQLYDIFKKEMNIKEVIREEIRSLLKEDPKLWKYIYNFDNKYVPSPITESFKIGNNTYQVTRIEDDKWVHVIDQKKNTTMFDKDKLKKRGIDLDEPTIKKAKKVKGMTKREFKK